jgi:hypothetical protein
MRSLFKETSDMIKDTIRESWKLYEGCPAENIASRNNILSGIRQSQSMYSKHQRMIVPSIDEIYYRRELKKLTAEVFDSKQAEKN